MPRGHSPRVDFPADHFEFTRVWLDFEHCHAVVTAVRIVEEPPAGVDADLRGGVGAGKVGRQCRDGLLPDERSAHRIIIEDGDRGGQFRQDVGVLPIGMEGHVPWSGTGRDPCERYRVRVERARTLIEVPQIDLVGPEVDAEHVIAVEVGDYLVRVRPLLAGRVGSGPVADTLEIFGHCANRTVRQDPKYLKVTAGIAGRE